MGFLRAADSVGLPPQMRSSASIREVYEEGPLAVPVADTRLRESPALFQLAYMGPDMPRSLGSKDDRRVNFPPDDWQQRWAPLPLSPTH